MCHSVLTNGASLDPVPDEREIDMTLQHAQPKILETGREEGVAMQEMHLNQLQPSPSIPRFCEFEVEERVSTLCMRADRTGLEWTGA